MKWEISNKQNRTRLVVITALIAFSTVFLLTGVLLTQVYGQSPNMKYTDNCENYRMYTDWKGITRYEANSNTTLIDERIKGNMGYITDKELTCLQGIRAAEQEEISKLFGPADIDQAIERNNHMLEVLEKYD